MSHTPRQQPSNIYVPIKEGVCSAIDQEGNLMTVQRDILRTCRAKHKPGKDVLLAQHYLFL